MKRQLLQKKFYFKRQNPIQFNEVYFDKLLLSCGPSTAIIIVKTELPPIATTAKAANTYKQK